VDLCQCDESLGGVLGNLTAAHPGVQILRELEQGETLTYAGLGDPQALGDALDRQAVLAQPVIGAGAIEGSRSERWSFSMTASTRRSSGSSSGSPAGLTIAGSSVRQARAAAR